MTGRDFKELKQGSLVANYHWLHGKELMVIVKNEIISDRVRVPSGRLVTALGLIENRVVEFTNWNALLLVAL